MTHRLHHLIPDEYEAEGHVIYLFVTARFPDQQWFEDMKECWKAAAASASIFSGC